MEFHVSDETRAVLCEYVPHWHACVSGPVPFGQYDRVQLTFDHLIVATRDDAEDLILRRVMELCDLWRREFDPTEWLIHHIILRRGN